MKRFTLFTLGIGLLLTAALFIGCSSTPSGDSTISSNTTGATAGGEESKFADALAKLSAEDRAAAEKQRICPVSEKPLGSMGTPVKLTDIEGQDVFICCGGCEDTLREDPATHLAKLKQ